MNYQGLDVTFQLRCKVKKKCLIFCSSGNQKLVFSTLIQLCNRFDKVDFKVAVYNTHMIQNLLNLINTTFM